MNQSNFYGNERKDSLFLYLNNKCVWNYNKWSILYTNRHKQIFIFCPLFHKKEPTLHFDATNTYYSFGNRYIRKTTYRNFNHCDTLRVLFSNIFREQEYGRHICCCNCSIMQFMKAYWQHCSLYNSNKWILNLLKRWGKNIVSYPTGYFFLLFAAEAGIPSKVT